MIKEEVAIIRESRRKMYNMLEYKENELKIALKENQDATLNLFKEYDEDTFKMIYLYSDTDDYSIINYYLTIDKDFDIGCVGFSTDGSIYEDITYGRMLELLTVYNLEYVYDYFVRNIERVKNSKALNID